MPNTSTRLRVFLASPGDVSEERERVAEVIDEINRLHGEDEGFHLNLIRWETDSRPQLGRPQGVLNEQLRPEDTDIFIGIMWKRFGQPTKKAGSGTEEEFQRAYDAYQSGDGPEILFFFCDRAVPTSTDTQQLQKVQSFREKFQRLGLYQTYETVDDFKAKLRQALVRTVRSVLSDDEGSETGTTEPSNRETQANQPPNWMGALGDQDIPDESSASAFGNIPMPRRRSEPSDLEKSEALKDGFKIIKEYFRKGKKKIESEYSDLRILLDEIDSRTLEAELFVSGDRKSQCRLWIGGSMGKNTIAFAEGSTARSGGGMNDYVMLKSRNGELFFEASGMGFSSTQSPGTRLDPEDAARYFWERFLRPMMH